MYTSQLHSPRDVIISRRAPGRSLLQPPLGILLALPLGNDSSIYPLPSDHTTLLNLHTQAFSPRLPCRPGPSHSTWPSPASFRPASSAVTLKFSICMSKKFDLKLILPFVYSWEPKLQSLETILSSLVITTTTSLWHIVRNLTTPPVTTGCNHISQHRSLSTTSI